MRRPSPATPLRRLAAEPSARRVLALGGLLSAGQFAATLAAWLLLARVLNGLAFGKVDVGALTPQMLALAALLIARAGLAALREGLLGALAAGTVAALRARLTRRLEGLGPLALTGERGAELATTALSGLDRLIPALTRSLPGAVHTGVYALGGLAALLWLDPLAALVVALTLPVSLAFLWLVGLAAGGAADAQWAQLTRLGARTVNALRALSTLRAFGQAAAHARSLTREAETYRAATLRVLRLAFLNGFVLDLAATLSVALVAVTTGIRLFEGELEFGVALAVLLVVPEVFAPLRQLGADRHASLEAAPAAARLYALLDMPEAEVGSRPIPEAPHLVLEDLSVALDGSPVLDGLSLDLPPGAHIAITGPSGAGKTTLLHALLGYAPHTGRLLLNGHPLTAHDLAAWRRAAPLVTQRPRFLVGTVRDTLRAVSEADDERLTEVLSLVGLDASLDTHLAEDGHPLSGGERARLALARALLSPAPLLLLDEPTAHLDPQGEAELLTRLARHLRGRTVLLVTHRAVPPGFARLELRDGRLTPTQLDRVPA